MPYCGSQVCVKDYPHQHRTAAVLSCRSWTCPDCAPRRKRQLVAEICGGNPNRFLTLTIRRSMAQTPERALEMLNHAWRTLRKLICHQYELDTVHAFTVVEPHQSGWPHLHIFLRGPWIDWAWLSNKCTQLIDSPHVYIQAIDGVHRVGHYVAKYTGKCMKRIGTKKRYYKTRQYEQREERRDPPRKTPSLTCIILDERLDWIVETWQLSGLLVERVGNRFAAARPPP